LSFSKDERKEMQAYSEHRKGLCAKLSGE